MTEIPEHLRKRAEAARDEGRGRRGRAEPRPRPRRRPPRPPRRRPTSRIPAHLLERSRAAKAKAGGGDADAPARPAAAPSPWPSRAGGGRRRPPPAGGGVPVGAGPGGHTQRLLTVVKSGSIQDVKATPVDKVHVWPHLLVVEFVAALAMHRRSCSSSRSSSTPRCSQLANVNQTPNPSKAPWYFLGLQELLTMFHPMVAGVTIPGMGLVVLILAPLHRQEPVQQAGGPQVRHRRCSPSS